MNERAKARLDWKFEVAFRLLEVFDRLVSSVGAISLVKVTKCSGSAEWHPCRHSVILGLNPWIGIVNTPPNGIRTCRVEPLP